MKKYLMIIAAAVLALSFTACKNQPGKKSCTFEISVTDVKGVSATVTVTPSDTSVYYYYDVLQASIYEQYGKDSVVSAIIGNMQYYIDMYAQYGMKLTMADLLYKGVDSYEYDELNANTDYVVIAFAVDTLNKALDGEVFTKPFKTGDVEKVSLSFDVQYTDTAVFLIPNDNKIEYLYTIIEPDTLQAYGLTPQQALEQYNEYLAQAYSEYYSQYYGYEVEVTLADLTATGGLYIAFESAEEKGFELGAEYMFIARAYTSGTFNSDLVTKTFVLAPQNAAPSRMVKEFNKHHLFEAPKIAAPAKKFIKK